MCVYVNGRLSSRIRFMCLDLIDLRAHNWVPRQKKAEAKTLAAVRKEDQASKAASAAGAGRGRGKGPGSFSASGPQDVRNAGYVLRSAVLCCNPLSSLCSYVM